MSIRQPGLFRPWDDVQGRQLDLINLDGPELSALSCETCGEPMERTPSGYLCCPRGHGKLIEEPSSQDCGSWFDADE